MVREKAVEEAEVTVEKKEAEVVPKVVVERKEEEVAVKVVVEKMEKEDMVEVKTEETVGLVKEKKEVVVNLHNNKMI